MTFRNIKFVRMERTGVRRAHILIIHAGIIIMGS